MSRRSAADRKVICIEPRSRRLQPPPDLEAKATEIFCDLVATSPHNHFAASDQQLLAVYCQALMVSRQSAGEPGLIQQWQKATQLVAQLAPKLRLCPSSRVDPKTTGRAMDRPYPSFYERQESGDA